MTIRGVCPHCDHAFRVADELRGKRVRCKNCQKPFAVGDSTEAPAEVIPQLRPKKRRPARSASGWSLTRIIALSAAGVAVVVGAIGLIWFLKHGSTAKTLPGLVAQLDRQEPGWRMDGLEANRPALAANQNSAPVIQSAQKLFNKDWISSSLQDAIRSRSPNVKLDGQTASELKAALDKVQPAVVEARRVAGLPQGHFSITYARNGISTMLPHLQPLRELTTLLTLDATSRAEEADAAGAMTSCRASFHLARAISDEPISISQLVRVACNSVSVSCLERLMAQVQLPDDSLIALQKLLEDEAAQPVFLIMMRSERASVDAFMTSLRNGSSNLSEVGKLLSEQGIDKTLLKNEAEVDRAHFLVAAPGDANGGNCSTPATPTTTPIGIVGIECPGHAAAGQVHEGRRRKIGDLLSAEYGQTLVRSGGHCR